MARDAPFCSQVQGQRTWLNATAMQSRYDYVR